MTDGWISRRPYIDGSPKTSVRERIRNDAQRGEPDASGAHQQAESSRGISALRQAGVDESVRLGERPRGVVFVARPGRTGAAGGWARAGGADIGQYGHQPGRSGASAGTSFAGDCAQQGSV